MKNFFEKKKKNFSENIFSKFVFKPSTPQKFHSLIFDLLALSGKIFLREKISTRFLSPFCNLIFFLFQKHFFGNFLLWTDWNLLFSLGNDGTSLLPGRMVYILEPSLLPGRMVYILEPSLSPWENGLHFGTSLLPGRMVYILELLFSLGEKSSTRRIWRDFPKFFILSSLIKTLFSLGEWFTFWNFSSPWENGSVFQLASIFLPKSVGFLSNSMRGDT